MSDTSNPVPPPPVGAGVAPPAPLSPRMRAFVLVVDRGILRIARHWVLAVNVVTGLFVFLPLLGPWLLSKGIVGPANALYLVFRLTCHQMASRSFVVFGHQMCICQRCFAIYCGALLFGLVYPLLAGWLRPLRWRWMFVLWLPMAIDGFTQLFGLRESTWQLRLVTGALFALSCAWVGFPHLRRGFAEMRDTLEARFARVAARETAARGPA